MEKSNPQNEKQQNKRIGIIAIIIMLGLFYWIGKGSNSSPSHKPTQHVCTWCKKEYSGDGYHHIGNSCEEASNGWEQYDNKCSMKCCQEAWNNGKH
jgi:hypothetical protein